MNSGMIPAVFVGALLAAGCIALFRRSPLERSIAGTILVVAGFFSVFAILFEPVIGYQGVLTIAAVLVVVALPLSTRTALISAAVAGVLAGPLGYLWAYRAAAPVRERVANLREEYPIVDLSDRLADEHDPEPDTEPTEPAIEQTERFEADLDKNSDGRREEALRELHGEALDRFVAAGGFGVGRMFGHLEARLDHWEDRAGDKSAEDAAADGEGEPERVYQPSEGEVVPVAVEPENESLHRTRLAEFFNRERTGWVIEPRRAAGFLAHRFKERRVADVVNEKHTYIDSVPWRLERIELVGLLLHREPVVYESPDLPDLAELATYTTRPLDQFETTWLPSLRAGEEVVVARVGGDPRMLGAIRAADSCLKCHDVERGTLLGAFSYAFSDPNADDR